ncbi:prolyl oligopeptidase family serine peptidase [soil metagenome]
MFFPLFHQAAPQFPLTVESIMRGPGLIGRVPNELQWTDDGSYVSFSWGKADGNYRPKSQRFRVNKDGTGLVQKDDEPEKLDPSDGGVRLGNLAVYAKEGDLYLLDSATNSTKRLTETTERESNPSFAGNASGVIYSQGGNLYRLNLSDGSKQQLTNVAADAKVGSGLPFGVAIPAGYAAGSFSVSPSGHFAALNLFENFKAGRRADVPNYVTDSGYPEMIPTYQRVGAPQSSSKLVVINLESGQLTDILPVQPGRMFRMQWAPSGDHGVVQISANDNKDDWIVGFDGSTGKASVLWDEHCDAWVGGPGENTLGWLPSGDRFYFESEKNGFANLYSMPATGGEATVLVGGNFEVDDVRLDEARRRFTFVSSEGSPFIRHLDTVGVDGGPHRKMADLSADEDMTYAIAPDGEQVAVVRSKPNRPGELFVNGFQVTTTPSEEWLSYPWTVPDVVWVPSTDGVKVPARLYKPKNWNGGPAVIFAHGAGYLQNVYDGWSHYYREYMFQHLLMSRGYVVLDVDYRASAGYGRDWRTAIYRHMGGKDLDDQVAGADYLVKNLKVDKNRIGIYGGSYGGFLTFMAMFTKPGVFAAGAALRPVADWKTYNDGYTAPILNRPQDDPEAYRISSPINFVEGLQGHLLICHGMVDTNVTFQDSVRVVERLIELRKKNWQVAPYPVDNHDFSHEASWVDEYSRILDLFETTIGNRRGR